MSYTIKQLIEGHDDLVVVKLNEPVQKALDLMHEHKYSQLPVVNNTWQNPRMITSDSILDAQCKLGMPIEKLKVLHALIKVPTFRKDADLFELLGYLRDYNAALIVDGNVLLTGLVTRYDIAGYFSQRAEDMMLVEDIERALKDFIEAAFEDATGEIDQAALDIEILNVIESKYGKPDKIIKNALTRYLELSGQEKAEINSAYVEVAFSPLLKKKPKKFNELNLDEYVDLSIHVSKKLKDCLLFGLDSSDKKIKTLFEGVRNIRNDLAHFRREISHKDRDVLRYCKRLLVDHQPNKETPEDVVITVSNSVHLITTDEDISLLDDNRYALLARWLQNQPFNQKRLLITFEQIESIINRTLPLSARQHPSWWSNDSSYNTQSQWVEVGWRVANIRLNEETVVFARMKDREKAYIEFFNALLSELSAASDIPWNIPTPDGQGWVHVFYFPEGKKQIPLAYSFARGGRLRVELYIAIGNKAKNKQIFDELYSLKNEIENKVGEPLTWERMDEKDASRIALYHAGAITDSPEQLSILRAWAVNAMAQFYNAIAKPVNDAIRRTGLSSLNKIPHLVSKQFPNQFQNNSPDSFKTIPHFF